MARHLVAAGTIIDEDSELALQHAIAARRMASRISVVREAVGLAAYAAGDWTTAIAELRTYHRMTGRQTHLAELADCERALGRPERAIDLFRGADRDAMDKAGAIELLIVAAGARGDLGQHDAAVAMLQVKELTTDEGADWAARLRYAYADALLAAGRRDEAREWFSRAAAADEDDVTDAAERLLELDGVTIEGDDEDEDDEAADGERGPAVDGAAGADEDGADLDDDEDGDDSEEDEDAAYHGAAFLDDEEDDEEEPVDGEDLDVDAGIDSPEDEDDDAQDDDLVGDETDIADDPAAGDDDEDESPKAGSDEFVGGQADTDEPRAADGKA
ncbi:Replicase polyprotein 1ab [Actinoplanes sp. NPDC049316]|uniref:Replicase polyprotein 1ab n=1 Tax=Actinoplanes sp. NPDC049316 TaxID=3154727 RepID=UPI00344189E5